MDADSFTETVETASQTQLDRIGSSKLLVALTDADLSEGAVLRVAADSEAAAAEVFDSWTADATSDTLRAAHAAMAGQERDHLDRVLAALDDTDGAGYDPGEGGAIHEHLHGLDDPIERLAAGYVGRGLLARRTHTQLVSFFVNEQDTERAALFRELKTETMAQVEQGSDLLAEHCEDESDWQRAQDAAESIIQVAYDEYVASLEGLGINPKSVC